MISKLAKLIMGEPFVKEAQRLCSINGIDVQLRREGKNVNHNDVHVHLIAGRSKAEYVCEKNGHGYWLGMSSEVNKPIRDGIEQFCLSNAPFWQNWFDGKTSYLTIAHDLSEFIPKRLHVTNSLGIGRIEL